MRYGEPVCPGFDHVFTGRLLHAEESSFQRIEVYEHDRFGRMLTLDGVVQTSERDEFCYHEMLVHPALVSREGVGRVLVIGGGDGGTARRVLQHGPDEVVMCEIDEAVVRVCREHLPTLAAGAFDDERVTLVFEDGAAFVAEHTDAFDAIVVDSTDPVGPGVALFARDFYADCRRALRPRGVLVAQTGSPIYQEEEFRSALGNLVAAFGTCEVHSGCVPTYPGQLWTYASATLGEPISSVAADEVRERLVARGIEPRYYTPELHSAAFVLPAFVARLTDDARAASVRGG